VDGCVEDAARSSFEDSQDFAAAAEVEEREAERYMERLDAIRFLESY
jgi:hypothetical protein